MLLARHRMRHELEQEKVITEQATVADPTSTTEDVVEKPTRKYTKKTE